MLDYVFDSTAIRDIGKLADSDWEALRAEWDRQDLKTAWIPMTIAEVGGTNLVRKEEPLTDDDFRLQQVAIQRFDCLARGQILPEQNDRVRRSFFELAEEDLAEPDTTDSRTVLDLLHRATGVSDLDIASESWAVRVGVVLPGTDRCQGLRIPLGFFDEANTAIEGWRNRTQLTADASDDKLRKEVANHLSDVFENIASRLDIPGDVTARALQPSNDLMSSALAYRAVAEQTFYLLHAIGVRTGAVRENDGRDIVIATYLADGWRLVTDDGGLRALLRRLIADENRLVRFESLREVLRGSQANT